MGIFARQFHWEFAPRRSTQLALVQPVLDLPATRKVVIVGGAADAMLRFRGPLIKELGVQGFDVVCASEPANAEAQGRFAALGARHVTLPLRGSRALWKLFRLLRRERPNVVLSDGLRPSVHGALAGWLAGVERRIAMVEGLGYAHTHGRAWLYRVPCALSDTLIVQNQDDRAVFAKTFMRGREARIHVVPGVGVDLEEYQPEPMPKGPLTFVMIARLLRDTGVYEFAEAARRLKEQQLDVRLVLVGSLESGPRAVRREDLEAWVRDGRLEHAGDADDVRPWIREAHVLVLPSYREGLPRAVMEAMAMGRPCIVTDVPGCRDVVTHHRNGIIVDAQNPAALVDAATLFVQRRRLLDPWSRAAVQAAKTNFDAARQAADMAALLLSTTHPANREAIHARGG